jgi:hypothetical protein
MGQLMELKLAAETEVLGETHPNATMSITDLS